MNVPSQNGLPSRNGSFSRALRRKFFFAGYGVWAYRDYYDNMLYNNGFFLQGRGWETQGNVVFEKAGDSAACRLTAPAAIRQEVPDGRDGFDGKELTVSFEVTDCTVPGTITVTLGTQRQTVQANHAGVYQTVFPRRERIQSLALDAESGTFAVDNIRLYDYVQHGLLYDPDNRPLEQRDNLREMNRLLSGDK